MKLVMRYTEGDGCTYSATSTLPLEHSSAEAALVEFETALLAALQGRRHEFSFCGQILDVGTFAFRGVPDLPEFLTIDEWFQTYELGSFGIS